MQPEFHLRQGILHCKPQPHLGRAGGGLSGKGLLVAGRNASMDHKAMAATRVMATCMAMGEAAGAAARIAIEDGVDPSEVDVKKVQKALLDNGGYLR